MTRPYTTYMLPANVCHMLEGQIVIWKLKFIFHKLAIKCKVKVSLGDSTGTTSRNQKGKKKIAKSFS